jgi:hypothetical protein
MAAYRMLDLMASDDRWQTRTCCHEFAPNVFRATSPMQQDRRLGVFCNKRQAFRPQDALPERTAVEFYTEAGERKHSAFHVADGLCIWKLGSTRRYCVTDVAMQVKLYDSPVLYACVLDARCDACRTSREIQQLKLCGKCRAATYCNRECQRAHWSEHKQHCESIGKMTKGDLSGGKAPALPSVNAVLGGLLADPILQKLQTLLQQARTESVPCTHLERLNEPNAYRTALEIESRNPAQRVMVAELDDSLHLAVLKLSDAGVLGFELRDAVRWTGARRYPLLSAEQAGTLQVPLFLVFGFNSNAGYFRLVWTDGSYDCSFHWMQGDQDDNFNAEK